MNLSQLYYFQKLAELQHYTHAAEELYISQPTLSHAIASLEDDLGCDLFRKEGRNVRLTEEGAFFKDYVDRSLTILDEGIAALKKRHGRLSGTVNLGAVATVRSDYLPAALVAYRRLRGSLVRINAMQAGSEELLYALERGDIDFAIGAEAVVKRGYAFDKLFVQSLVVAVDKGHPLASRKSLSIQDLRGYDVFTYRRETPPGQMIDSFLRANNLNPDAANLARSYDDELMIGALTANEPVVGLVLQTSSLLMYRNLKIVPLKEDAARELYPIGLIYKEGAQFDPATQDFMEFLRSFPHSDAMMSALEEE